MLFSSFSLDLVFRCSWSVQLVFWQVDPFKRGPHAGQTPDPITHSPAHSSGAGRGWHIPWQWIDNAVMQPAATGPESQAEA